MKLLLPTSLVPGPAHERKPSYLLFAGLMFIPLTTEYLATWDWSDVDPRFKHLYTNELPSAERREIVLLSHVLADAANAGYHQIRGAVVTRANGVAIRDMKDLARTLRTPVGKHHVIEIDNHVEEGTSLDYHSTSGTHVVLRASDVADATREVLATYGVTRDRSADLDRSRQPGWKQRQPPAQHLAVSRARFAARRLGDALAQT